MNSRAPSSSTSWSSRIRRRAWCRIDAICAATRRALSPASPRPDLASPLFASVKSAGLITRTAALERLFTALNFLWKKLPHHRGFFYHFANINTGERVWESEISSVDTAILLCGVLTCREHFKHSAVTQLADLIFGRVEWTWLSEDTSLLSHGWTPEIGFLPSRWDYYSELMMMYLLGMGSRSHPLKPEAWNAWKRLTFEYDGLRYIGSFAPLFVHQFSQAWFDFRGKRDKFADYFQNSIIATEVHRRFCLELGKQFSDYSEDLWGITASDSVNGYVVWGGPPAVGPIDGTITPSATGGSLDLPSATNVACSEEHSQHVTAPPGANTASSTPSIRSRTGTTTT